MSKLVLTIGYDDYVFDMELGMRLMEALSTAEKYETKYNSEAGVYTKHIYPTEREFPAKLITNDAYNMAKLAGKPE